MVVLAAGAALSPATSGSAAAQDLEPRLFSAAPVGMNFGGIGYGISFGNVLLDPALAVEDARGTVHTFTAAYLRTINFFGASGKIDAIVPFSLGKWTGRVAGTDTFTTRTGIGDPRVRLSVTFVGAPALRAEEFVSYRQKTLVGASIQARIPLGQYDPERLINLGSNRWTFKTQVGFSQQVDEWIFDLFAAGWFFTPNDDFFGGNRVTQKPLWALQGHAGYIFRPGLWLVLDAGAGLGGRTTVNDAEGGVQDSWRFGAQLAIPIDRTHSIKLAWVTAVTTSIGADFDSFVVAYQVRWGGMPPGPPAPGQASLPGEPGQLRAPINR